MCWSREYGTCRQNEVGFLESVAAVRLWLVAGVELDFLVRKDGDMDTVRHAHPLGTSYNCSNWSNTWPCFETNDAECSSSGQKNGPEAVVAMDRYRFSSGQTHQQHSQPYAIWVVKL